MNVAQIAGELGLDQRTVAQWLAAERYRPRMAGAKPGILVQFKGEIGRMIEKHPYTATQIFQALQELGYSGSYNTVKRYVRKIRPKRPRRMRLGGLGLIRLGERG